MMRRANTAKGDAKRKFYAMMAIMFVLFWGLSSMAATALECFSNGGEITFGLGIDCQIDFSKQ